jgi:multisubunit Na+/H+ antiporter MnhG subunit
VTARHVIAGLLLAGGVGIALACCLGVVVARTSWDRLHAAAPAAVAASLLVAAAIVVDEGLSSGGVKAILVAVALACGGPIIGHATARAARIRGAGTWRLTEEERDHPEEP